MKKLIFPGLAMLIIVVSACSSIRHSYRQIEIPEHGLIVTPVVVDVEVDINKKVTATSPKIKGVENAISMAYYMAIQNSGADVIIDPVYKVTSKGRKSIATVSGYYGIYKNARKLTDALDEFEAYDTLNIKKASMLLNGFITPVTPTRVSETGKQKKKALKLK